MTINLDMALVFMLVLLRISGMILFNPLLGRQNIPPLFKAGMCFILTILVYGAVPAPDLGDPTLLAFMLLAVREVLIGLVAGVIFRMFLSVIVVGGEVIDMQLGISMAKAFDPGSNTSISSSAGFLNAMFILVFFVTNNHLTLIRMTAQTFMVIPIGTVSVNYDAFYYLTELFSSIFVFAMKLCLPVVVIEVIVTVSVGIIMRIIPQINIFVVNIQFKLLIGMLVLIVLVPSFMGFLENMIYTCFDYIRDTLMAFL